VLDAIENLATDFDFIDLHRTFKKGERFLPCLRLVPGCRLGRIGYTHMNATAYVMSQSGARSFLNHARRFAHAVDKEMHRYWANGLDIYGLEKPVAMQDDGGYSYIDETRGQDRSEERLRYPNADGLYWQLQRRWTKICDSLQKRRAFAAYCKRAIPAP
jgi:GR25 family glycosyltransferase involved in LPS biosynthesis